MDIENVQIDEDEDEVPFKDLSGSEKFRTVLIVIGKLVAFLASLYIFICSLGLLEAAFQLLGGKTAGKAFSSGVLSNPFAGLMIGVMATILVQSSSTSSSIVVTMVGSDIILVKNAVPIIMGVNIGTSVTNTIVSLAQATDRQQFRRAFSGATVHDMFNWLVVAVLLPLEIAVGYLAWLSEAIVDSMGLEGNHEKTPDMLKAITGPFIKSIVKVNKDIIADVAAQSNETTGDVLKRWCVTDEVEVNHTETHTNIISIRCDQVNASSSSLASVCHDLVVHKGIDPSSLIKLSVGYDTVVQTLETRNVKRCPNLFAQTDLADAAVGGILLIIALALILTTLYLIVKILNSMLSGSVSKMIKRTINSDLPDPFSFLTGYLALLVGVGMTILVQSSSVFTSTLTPLVGLGIVSVERMYPMTLGSNVGTTVTAILAALSQSGDKLRHALQIAMCHLFFNITGILLFYPFPFMRWPIAMAKTLGKTTSKHRWFAIFYLITMFVIFPGSIFALSYAGWLTLAAVGLPILLLFLTVIIINVLQRKRPGALPKVLRSWEFLPAWCHSLKPIDRLIELTCRCRYCRTLQQAAAEEGSEDVAIVAEVEKANGLARSVKDGSEDTELTIIAGDPISPDGVENPAFDEKL
ncbi:sodium-dependent phosphate transport protein 2B [Elysia marginata]|uniref:Sodium-dependent phosphate transport protein 2B n=1 Tax=Elysia marginata TaxID=1093978 RepID=A0AAV4H844_9GAST|nr:sodium-dependent phosphate transport protein 2B [Elysia marginata]